MGWRIRKSLNLGPFRLTASKSGLSVSAGTKWRRVTRTASGRVRKTTTIPGTGISHVQESSTGRSEDRKMKATRKNPKKRRWIWIALAAFLILGAIGSCNNDADAPDEASPQPTETLRTIVEPSSAPDPVPTPEPERSSPTDVTPEPMPEPTPTPTPAPVQHDYVLNTNTGKFHKPSCGSVKDIKDSNRRDYTGTREEVIDMGYEPCSRCNP